MIEAMIRAAVALHCRKPQRQSQYTIDQQPPPTTLELEHLETRITFLYKHQTAVQTLKILPP
jgi:hypothetical protein